MKITITVEDENLEYKTSAEAPTFELASEQFGTLERNYQRRVEMETKDETII